LLNTSFAVRFSYRFLRIKPCFIPYDNGAGGHGVLGNALKTRMFEARQKAYYSTLLPDKVISHELGRLRTL
jgi:hypothetical protein